MMKRGMKMKTIAIIDDDVYIGDMLREVLTQEGYSVLQAYSGTEALYLLSQNKPDLVLLDLMLPGLSGEEVVPRIEGISVIVLSAKVDVRDKVNLLLSGAVDYMTKPFDTEELLARITVQLRKAEHHEEAKTISTGDLVLDTVSLSLTVLNLRLIWVVKYSGNPQALAEAFCSISTISCIRWSSSSSVKFN